MRSDIERNTQGCSVSTHNPETVERNLVVKRPGVPLPPRLGTRVREIRVRRFTGPNLVTEGRKEEKNQ